MRLIYVVNDTMPKVSWRRVGCTSPDTKNLRIVTHTPLHPFIDHGLDLIRYTLVTRNRDDVNATVQSSDKNFY